MSDLDELICTLRQMAAGDTAGKGTKSGQLEGLLETGRARLAPKPGESVLHHAGYLAGHLTRWMYERGAELTTPTMMEAAVYGSALADPAGQRALQKADKSITAHLYAAIRVEKETDRPLGEAQERMMFGWLLEQTNTPSTSALIAKLERLRQRRQERNR